MASGHFDPRRKDFSYR